VEVRDFDTVDWKKRTITCINPLKANGMSFKYVRKIEKEGTDVNGDGLGDNKNELSTIEEFKQSPTIPIVIIVLVLAIMVLLYRQQPGPRFSTLAQSSIASNDANTAQRKQETNEVEAHTLGKNECRMDKDHKVICPACASKLGVPDDSVPPFKFTCPKCDTKIKVLPTEKF
jgi:hypothetical protein